MARPRILHIVDKLTIDGSTIHGVSRLLSYLVPCYDPEGHRVMVCSLRSDDAASDYLRARGLNVVCVGRKKFDPRTIFDICRIIRRWKPEILHLHGYASWNFGRVAGRFMKVPVVVHEHFIDQRMPGYQRVADWCLRGLQGRAIAVSEAVKEFMIRQRYVKAGDIEVVWNGIPAGQLRSNGRERIPALRDELGLSPETKVIGIVGRLEERKGHIYFLRAAKKVAQRIDRVVFLIVGDGVLSEELKHEAHVLGIKRLVRFVGYQQDVGACLSLCDVSVIASISVEGFCLVGIESFAAGTPVVITDFPDSGGPYEHRKNVLKVPPCDSNAMADVIVELLEHPELAAELIRDGRKSLEACDIANTAERYARVYEGVLGEMSQARTWTQPVSGNSRTD